MATLKQRMHKKNSSGSYDTVHLETSSSLVLRPSGRTVEQDLADYLPKTQASDTPPSTLKSGQISIGNSVAYIKTKWRTLAIATNTESGVPFNEITSSTGGSDGFTWNNNNGYHLHEIIHDIIKTTYTYLLYSYTIDTAGVFNGYNRTVKVATNNYDVNSQTATTIGEYYFPAGQTMTFRFLIYRAHGIFNIRSEEHTSELQSQR